MKLIKKGEGEIFEAKRHFGCWAMHKVIPDKDSKRLNIGFSQIVISILSA